MTPVLRTKPGCAFAVISPAGFVILAALQSTCFELGLSLMITAGTNDHVLPDPHASGSAYDISIADLTDGQLEQVLAHLRAQLPAAAFTVLCEAPTLAGLSKARAEMVNDVNPAASAPHVHIQRKKGTVYPAVVTGASA